MINFKVLSWNCRGARSPLFHCHLQDLLHTHKPSVLALLETKVNSKFVLPRIYKYSSFNKSVCVEAKGFVGGIWLLWDENSISLEVASIHDQVITAIIQNQNKAACVIYVVYASPNVMVRSFLWEFLRSLGHVFTAPWLLIGDWNQVLHPWDKMGGRLVSCMGSKPMWDMITSCALMDLGYSGNRYTWSNLRTDRGLIKERLDHAWCNEDWHSKFPYATVKHSYWCHFDHVPILLSTGGPQVRVPHGLNFHMLTAWFHHADFGQVVARAWEGPLNPLQQSMELFKKLAQSWNKLCFGNIF